MMWNFSHSDDNIEHVSSVLEWTWGNFFGRVSGFLFLKVDQRMVLTVQLFSSFNSVKYPKYISRERINTEKMWRKTGGTIQ